MEIIIVFLAVTVALLLRVQAQKLSEHRRIRRRLVALRRND